MRLIRLVSAVPQIGVTMKSEFENHFNDNIIIKANAKVGLLSASLPILSSSITIDDTCNTFQYKSAATYDFSNIVLPNGEYDVDSLLSLMTTEMWSRLSITSNGDTGMYIKLKLRRDKKVALIVHRCIQETMNPDATITINTNVTIGAAATNYPLTRTVAAADNTSYLYSNIPILPSCSFIRTRIIVLAPMILGLCTQDYDPTTGILDDNAFSHAIKIEANGAGVMIYKTLNEDGSWTNGADALVADYFAVEVTFGQIRYKYYRGIDPFNLAVLRGFTQLENHNFAIGLRGATASCRSPLCIYDPRIVVNSTGDLVNS